MKSPSTPSGHVEHESVEDVEVFFRRAQEALTRLQKFIIIVMVMPKRKYICCFYTVDIANVSFYNLFSAESRVINTKQIT